MGTFYPIHLDMRNCFHCVTDVETEEHVVLECPLYNDIRQELFSTVDMPSNSFDVLSNHDKVCLLLSDSSVINYSAKACHEILLERRKLLYS